MTEEAGKNLRKTLPRRELATLRLPDRDPLAILEDQHRTRLPDLIGVRVGRMLDSPFAYYRGTAAVMAADLAAEPVSGPRVVSCGDAHISNFGFFASPERTLLFDLNDFDEAGIAPWEWDVKRLAASVHIGGRDIGLSEAECRAATASAVRAYVTGLGELTQLSPFDRYFAKVSSDDLETRLTAASRRVTRKATTKARTRTSEQVLGKITSRDEDGLLRIVDQPPVTRHVGHASTSEIEDLFAQYLGTMREDSAYLLSQYRPADVVLRVVGVGSVGTRCYVLAMEGSGGDAQFLQAKEAQPSVLTTYGGMPATIPGAAGSEEFSEGRRVVAGQRILQAQSDPFLGHIVGFAGDKGRDVRVDYYWRQFRDMKGSIEPSRLSPVQFDEYGQACGKLLARAHSQSSSARVVAGYVGAGDRVPQAIADWAAAYADVVEADFAALERAADAGRFPVERGV